MHSYRSNEILSMSNKQFSNNISSQLKHSLGRMKLVGERYPYRGPC